jgi:ankyrin repeat protein
MKHTTDNRGLQLPISCSKLLLAFGEDSNDQDKMGNTAPIGAAFKRFESIVVANLDEVFVIQPLPSLKY